MIILYFEKLYKTFSVKKNMYTKNIIISEILNMY